MSHPTMPTPARRAFGTALRRALPAVALAWAAGTCAAQAPRAQPPAPGANLTDRLIVKYRGESAPVAKSFGRFRAAAPSAASAAEAVPPLPDEKRKRLGGKFGESTFALGKDKATSFGARVLPLGRVVHTEEARQLAQRLMADDPDIEYAVPDRYIYLAQAAPSDPLYADQWALNDPVTGVRAIGAWFLFNLVSTQRRTDPGFPLVAVVDTGYRPHVDMPTPDFGLDYVDGAPTPLDTGDARTAGQCPNLPDAQASTWHGLAVAGIIAASVNNGTGTAGLASPGAGVLHQRVFGPCGGYLSSYLAAIHDAVDYRNAHGQRVRVINLSQGSPAACDAPLQAEITRAIEAGVVVVASAGNGNTDVSVSSPANCSGIISVAATDRFGNRAPYSNHGSGVTLAAPGGDSYTRAFSDGILTTTLNLPGTEPTGQQASDYNYVQGTSFSAPHVSAAAALMLNMNPALTPAQVKRVLIGTARPLPVPCELGCGAGLLDARRAVERVERQKLVAAVCRRWPFALPVCPRIGPRWGGPTPNEDSTFDID